MQLLLTSPYEGMVILKEISFSCGSPDERAFFKFLLEKVKE